MKKLEDMNEVELRDLMNALAHGIEIVCEKMSVEKPYFTLLLFNDPKLGQYVSNCERKSMIEALYETAGRLKRKEDVPR